MRSRRALLVLLPLLLCACASQRVFEEGQGLIAQGRVEEGIAKIDEAAKLDPGNRAYRQSAIQARELAQAQWLALAEAARTRGRPDEARALYQRVQALDPGSQRARLGLAQLEQDERARKLIGQAEAALKQGALEAAYGLARDAVAASPGLPQARAVLRRIEEHNARAAPAMLRAAFRKPVSMAFRSAPLRMVLELLSKSTGLNFLFDREVKQDQPITIAVTDTSVEDVLRFMLLTSQLDHRVLNERTVLIYPATPAKHKEYQELIVKTFFLGNSDPKIALNLIRSVVKTRDVFIDEKLGMLVMRDTADAVRMAEKLLANQDRAEPEVMLELEVLEVARTDLQELGVRFPDQVTFSAVGASGAGGQLTLPEWQNRGSELVRLGFNNPAFILNFRNQFSRSNLLANPRIRVKNREKAKVHIGDKVPVITTTATSTGFVSESVGYVDVGLKLDVEPVVHIEEEIGIRVALEVSNIVEQTRTQSGTLAYRIGTRNAATVLRLKDGETQVLAGLISDEERSGANRVPGLGQLPLVGRLFGSQLDQSTRTEIMLLVTPRVVRPLLRPDPRDMEFASGTETSAGARIAFAPVQVQAAHVGVVASTAPVVLPGAGTKPLMAQAPFPTAAGTEALALAQPVAVPTATAPTTLAYLSAPEQVKAGATFTVGLGVSASAALRGASGKMFYDPLHFRVVGVQAGPLLKAVTPPPRIEFNAGETPGAMSFTAVSATDLPATGTLVTITVRALGSGGRSVLRLEDLRLTGSAGKPVASGVGTPPLVTIVK